MCPQLRETKRKRAIMWFHILLCTSPQCRNKANGCKRGKHSDCFQSPFPSRPNHTWLGRAEAWRGNAWEQLHVGQRTDQAQSASFSNQQFGSDCINSSMHEQTLPARYISHEPRGLEHGKYLTDTCNEMHKSCWNRSSWLQGKHSFPPLPSSIAQT